jgi:hypothetical protein
MKPRIGMRARGNRERGYAVLIVLFLVATLLLFSTVATPSILLQGRREKEQDLIWRGNQYMRAVRLFYQKNGRYPQSMEELIKPNATGVHFLRKPYIEPLNATDGTWRMIYVTPTGQLIGSVHYRTLQEMAVASAFAGQAGSGSAAMAAQLFGPAAAGAPQGGAAAGSQPTAQAGAQNNGSPGAQSGFGQQSGFGAQSGFGQQSAQAGQGFGSSAQPVPVGSLQAVDGPVFGGSIIGVASKVKKASVIVYQGGKTYFDWEFIWNPLLNVTGAGQPGVPGIAAVNPNNPNNPNGTQPGAIPSLAPGMPTGIPPLAVPPQ